MDAEAPPDVKPAVETQPPRHEPAAAHVAESISDVSCAAPDSLEEKSVWVVDANSLIFQVFHALPEMSSPRGEQVGAVFGFVRDMLYLIEEKKPDALVCAFDLAGPTFRDELFADYKAERGEMPKQEGVAANGAPRCHRRSSLHRASAGARPEFVSVRP